MNTFFTLKEYLNGNLIAFLPYLSVSQGLCTKSKAVLFLLTWLFFYIRDVTSCYKLLHC